MVFWRKIQWKYLTTTLPHGTSKLMCWPCCLWTGSGCFVLGAVLLHHCSSFVCSNTTDCGSSQIAQRAGLAILMHVEYSSWYTTYWSSFTGMPVPILYWVAGLGQDLMVGYTRPGITQTAVSGGPYPTSTSIVFTGLPWLSLPLAKCLPRKLL